MQQVDRLRSSCLIRGGSAVRATLTCIALLLVSQLTVHPVQGQDATAPESTAIPTAVAPAVEAPPAPPAPTLNQADTAWVLVSTALVLMMTAPGLAMFYGGLVRKKNVLGVMMQCLSLMAVMSILWALIGYSLAFSPSLPGSGNLIGGLNYAMLADVTYQLDVAPAPLEGTIPRLLHMVYQMMFFIITPALICGGFAERMKYSAMLAFCVLWGLLVYCPVAHWVWSTEGWCSEFNPTSQYKAFDFAGGTVVHITSGVAALVCSIMLGRRLSFGQEPMPPHNLTYTAIGAALLWVGWFGFNAGSALTAGTQAVSALVGTHLAACGGVLGWLALEWYRRGKPSALGACSGAVAGLVCITPASGTCSPGSAIVLGLLAGAVCFYGCTSIKNQFGYDDTLDAFGVHGIGGLLGAVLTGVFATKAIKGGTEALGWVDGRPEQLWNQLVAAGAAVAMSAVLTFVILKFIDGVIGLRVSQAGELQGLDISEHGEEGYIFL